MSRNESSVGMKLVTLASCLRANASPTNASSSARSQLPAATVATRSDLPSGRRHPGRSRGAVDFDSNAQSSAQSLAAAGTLAAA
jgi:hypothetical protein